MKKSMIVTAILIALAGYIHFSVAEVYIDPRGALTAWVRPWKMWHHVTVLWAVDGVTSPLATAALKSE